MWIILNYYFNQYYFYISRRSRRQGRRKGDIEKREVYEGIRWQQWKRQFWHKQNVQQRQNRIDFPVTLSEQFLIMYAKSSEQSNVCLDCGLTFQIPSQLLNHKRRFCINSGYDNLQGLARIQFNGAGPTHQPKIGHKNYLQHYGSNSLTKVTEYDSLSASNLEKQMKNVNNFKRQLEGVNKYQRKEKHQTSRLGSSKSSMLSETRNNYLLEESQLDEELKRYEPNPKEESISPPTFIDQLNMKNHTILDKSNSSLGRMSLKDRIEYAKAKLDDLNEIKDLYVKNGGTKNEVRTHVDKMIEFYKKFLKENEEKAKGDGPYLNGSQEMIESRVSTPILKLRELNEDQLPASRRKMKKSDVKKEEKIEKSKVNQTQIPTYPQPFNYPYGQPPIIMMPYAPPTQNQSLPNQGIRFLQKMVELKSQQNQRLLEIMLEQKRRPNLSQQPTIIMPQYPSYPQNSTLPLNSVPPTQAKTIPRNKGSINIQDDYQFKKSMIDELISEEKVLMALQQQELDQIKLLSQLPKDLQQIKIKSIIKSSQTRHKVEKDILKQKMERLAYQQQNQTFEESRKVGNDRWAGQERKRLLQNQMKNYVNSFQAQFNSQPNLP